jgi:tRNA1(Val) A37 N6-methylase TrmN6
MSAAARQKKNGAYYTPDSVVAALVRWAIRAPNDRMLDPSCGDGRFVAAHRKSVGIEQDPESAATAMSRAPWALIHEGDFFAWAANTKERFDCAVGNPPFIRYQTFAGFTRGRALQLCQTLGAYFSGLSSSWAPFLVAAASLLKPGGRMAFVVPAEIGHAPYAAPLLQYLVEHFERVQIIAIRRKLFPELSEDCWLLYTEGFGRATPEVRFTVWERFAPTEQPPRNCIRIPIFKWRSAWKWRLRPFLMSSLARELYQFASEHEGSKRLGDLARVGIGYVSGANDFFHLRPSLANKLEIPDKLLLPTVRNGRALQGDTLRSATVSAWKKADEPVLLLHLQKRGHVPKSVLKYLDTDAGFEARESYKCRMRDPWYSVPDVQIPDYFLTYMSGVSPNLVRNSARCTCTNSVHSVRVVNKQAGEKLSALWPSPFVRLSCEIEGHPLGGGMLKLEPGEASQVLLPASALGSALAGPEIVEAIDTLRTWRHYAASA